jgi:hypothetical protein
LTHVKDAVYHGPFQPKLFIVSLRG